MWLVMLAQLAAGAAVFAVVLAINIIPVWRRDRRHKQETIARFDAFVDTLGPVKIKAPTATQAAADQEARERWWDPQWRTQCAADMQSKLEEQPREDHPWP